MKGKVYDNPACLQAPRNRFAPRWNPLYWGGAVGLVALIIAIKEELGEDQGKLIELGSACGESGSMFAGSGVFEKVWLVDRWNYAGQFEVAEFNLRRYPCAEMVQGDMFEIAKQWEEQVDVIYLDAEHDYDSVMDGLETWDKHLRPGGIWAGHDYNLEVWPGVVMAVDEFFPESEIRVFEDLSWMVIKTDSDDRARKDLSDLVDSFPVDHGDDPVYEVDK
ncbi:MAG: class I SAM-dependent methyltransferase [Verrucomicrobiota bacterium]